jgi:hypothetical protein
MKTARYSDAQIMSILKQAEGGVPVSELCCAFRDDPPTCTDNIRPPIPI